MVNKILVCTLCSQDFTRRYSADRHNQNLHHGQGKIVRMIDYVIGRIAGEYDAANPLAHRSRYKQQASPSSRSDGSVRRFPFTSVAHDNSQENASSTFPYVNDHMPDQQSDVNPVRTSTIPVIGTTSKYEEIQKRIRTLWPPELAETFLKQLSAVVIANGGNEEILDQCLTALGNNMNLKEAYFYLFGSSTKEANKRPPLYGHNVQHLSETSRKMLTEIEQKLKIRIRNNESDVHEEIERILKVLNSTHFTRHHNILDLELNQLR